MFISSSKSFTFTGSTDVSPMQVNTFCLHACDQRPYPLAHTPYIFGIPLDLVAHDLELEISHSFSYVLPINISLIIAITAHFHFNLLLHNYYLVMLCLHHILRVIDYRIICVLAVIIKHLYYVTILLLFVISING